MSEQKIRRIDFKGGHSIPDGTLTELGWTGLPGHINVKLKLPGAKAWASFPYVKIVDGAVKIPVNLAFLSYAREDADKVRELAARLKDDGVLTWFDREDLLPGELLPVSWTPS